MIADLLAWELGRGETGVDVHIRQTPPVFGFWEGARSSGSLRQRLRALVDEVMRTRPDAVAAIGCPGFNLALGRRCRDLGVPVVIIAPPQVWAWGTWRVGELRRAADKVVCLFDFEEGWLRRRGIDAAYLGYPLLDSVRAVLDRQRTLQYLALPPEARFVVFLPGSRPTETAYHRPLFQQAARVVEARTGARGVLVKLPPREHESGAVPTPTRYSAIAHADAALVVSGTATLETALLGVPQAVTYHLSTVSRVLARLLVRRDRFALPNILLGRDVVAERLEPDLRWVVEAVCRMLTDNSAWARSAAVARELRGLLGPPGAMARLAGLVMTLARSRQYRAQSTAGEGGRSLGLDP